MPPLLQLERSEASYFVSKMGFVNEFCGEWSVKVYFFVVVVLEEVNKPGNK